MALANSKFKIRFLFRQSLKNREKRTSFFCYLLQRNSSWRRSFFFQHTRGAKVMDCVHNNNLGFNFGYFSQLGIVLARDIIIVSEQVEEERRVTSSLCEIKQKMTRLSFIFIGLFLLIGKNSFLFFIAFLCLDTQRFLNFVALFLLQLAHSCPKRSIFSVRSVFIFLSV